MERLPQPVYVLTLTWPQSTTNGAYFHSEEKDGSRAFYAENPPSKKAAQTLFENI